MHQIREINVLLHGIPFQQDKSIALKQERSITRTKKKCLVFFSLTLKLLDKFSLFNYILDTPRSAHSAMAINAQHMHVYNRAEDKRK